MRLVSLLAVASVWLWQRKGWGYVVVGGLLTMWVIESLGVAADQWFGHAADPASAAIAVGMAPVFAALALVTLIPRGLYFRNLDRTAEPQGT